MVEIQIADFLQGGLSDYYVGQNLFVGQPPADIEDNLIFFVLETDGKLSGEFNRSRLTVVIVVNVYAEGRILAEQVQALLGQKVGSFGDWGIASNIIVQYEGAQKQNKVRHIFSVNTDIVYIN